MIIVVTQRLQRAVRIEHAAAARTEHVPGEVEQPEPGGMEQAGDHALFIETGPRRKIQRVDPVEFVILSGFDQAPDRIGNCWISRLLQHRKLGAVVVHIGSLEQITARSKVFANDFLSDGFCQRRVSWNIGERSGCVVTMPIGITGSRSNSVMRNAPTSLASASVASTRAKCAPMQTRAPTPNG